MKLVWTDPAIADLTAIRDYIARDSDQYARQFVGRIIEAVEKLPGFPAMGRKVPESRSRDNVREILFQNYRIIYRIASDKLHHHDPPWRPESDPDEAQAMGSDLESNPCL